MGGTRERGRGAFQGRLLYSPKPGAPDRVSHISLKIKCVALVRIPVVNPQMPYATQLMHRSPELERYHDKEQLVLQLEQTLYRAPFSNAKDAPQDVKQQYFHPSKAVANIPGAELLDSGTTAAFEFQVDLPRETKEGEELPPSFVLSADQDARAPSPADVRQYSTEPGLLGRGFSIIQSLKEGVAPAADRDQWANVKWYAKVTIGRPGVLQANDRILIPFQFLPPPPAQSALVLERRVRSTAQLRQNVPFNQLEEPSSSWQEISIGTAQSELQHKKRGLSALLSKSAGKRVESEWSFEWPTGPAVFPLQASIPFTIVSQTQRQIGSPLSVSLYRKVNLLRSKDMQALDERILCTARIAPKPAVLVSEAKGTATYRWQGVLDVPASAGPSFATPIVGVTYYVGVKEAHQASSSKGKTSAPSAPFVLIQPVVFSCPPPKKIRPTDSAGARPRPGPDLPPPLPPPSRKPNASAAATLSAADEKRALALAASQGAPPPSSPTAPTPSSAVSPSATPGPSISASTSATAIAPASSTLPVGPAGSDSAHTGALPPAHSPAQSQNWPESPEYGEELPTQLDLPPSYFEATGIRDQEA